jgi:hypothetical protein
MRIRENNESIRLNSGVRASTSCYLQTGTPRLSALSICRSICLFRQIKWCCDGDDGADGDLQAQVRAYQGGVRAQLP